MLDHADEFGLAEVSQNANGVHLSAGPVEGMAEVTRFFGETGVNQSLVQITCLGRALSVEGASSEAIISLVNNPIFEIGDRKISAFDLTEEMDTPQAVAALEGLV